MKYQIFVDRGNGLETSGCWGGDDNEFDSREDAEKSAATLKLNYPDCDWVVCDDDGNEVYRV